MPKIQAGLRLVSRWNRVADAAILSYCIAKIFTQRDIEHIPRNIEGDTNMRPACLLLRISNIQNFYVTWVVNKILLFNKTTMRLNHVNHPLTKEGGVAPFKILRFFISRVLPTNPHTISSVFISQRTPTNLSSLVYAEHPRLSTYFYGLTPAEAGRFGIYLLYAAPVSSVRHNPVIGALTQPHCHYSNKARKAGD